MPKTQMKTRSRNTTGEFVKGEDKAKIYRQLYAANRILQTRKNLPEVLELTQAAIGGVEFRVRSAECPAAAIMADELFESRTSRDCAKRSDCYPGHSPPDAFIEFLRGRIEEITGWALFQQGKHQEASVRLKRAVSILPEKSAWWRSSTWKLGAALDAAGKQPEALDMYIKNYLSGNPDVVKHSVIETLYQKVNGNLDGLDGKIGAKPVNTAIVSTIPPETVAQNTEVIKTETSPSPAPITETSATPETLTSPALSKTTETKASPEPVSSSKTEPNPTTDITLPPENKPEVKTEQSAPPKIESSPLPGAEKSPEVKPPVVSSPGTKTEEILAISPAPETKSENTETKTTEKPKNPGSEPDAKPTPKPLFEPIIITVPKTDTLKIQKPAATEESKNAVKSPETSADILKSKTPINGSGEVRERVSTANSTTDDSPPENSSCQLTVNQESVSILSQGGNLGILLGFQGAGGDISKNHGSLRESE